MRLFLLILLLISYRADGQIPADRLSNWKNSGLDNMQYKGGTEVKIEDFGGGTGLNHNNDSAIIKAIDFLSASKGGSIVFSKGKYLFRKSIYMRDSIILSGTGSDCILEFDLSHRPSDCIYFSGKISDKIFSVYAWLKNDYTLRLSENTTDFLYLLRVFFNDTQLCNNDWAYGEIGQIVKVNAYDSLQKTLTLKTPLRQTVSSNMNPRMQAIQPIVNAGISCLKIARKDSTVQQSSTINFTYAANCFIVGVELEMGNFAHIVFNRSAHNFVYGSYLHHAFNYGGGGKGYGIVLQTASSDNRIENNVLHDLRHSILLQSGANGNVISYNYSGRPYGSEMILPDLSGDMVCHGNYPHHNLFEGNICQNIVIDNSHGRNGPYNTFFRNRAMLYGILIGSAQDSQNFIANEITDTGFLKGQFVSNGNGHFKLRNNVRGILSDNLNLSLGDSSLYLGRAAGFWREGKAFKGIGYPFAYRQGNIPAYSRYLDSADKSYCHTDYHSMVNVTNSFDGQPISVYPNPLRRGSTVCISGLETQSNTIRIFGSRINEILSLKNQECFDTAEFPAGIYLLLINESTPVILAILE